jgi:hypothetical protein
LPIAGKKSPPMWRSGAGGGTGQLPKNLIVQ